MPKWIATNSLEKSTIGSVVAAAAEDDGGKERRRQELLAACSGNRRRRASDSDTGKKQKGPAKQGAQQERAQQERAQVQDSQAKIGTAHDFNSVPHQDRIRATEDLRTAALAGNTCDLRRAIEKAERLGLDFEAATAKQILEKLRLKEEEAQSTSDDSPQNNLMNEISQHGKHEGSVLNAGMKLAAVGDKTAAAAMATAPLCVQDDFPPSNDLSLTDYFCYKLWPDSQDDDEEGDGNVRLPLGLALRGHRVSKGKCSQDEPESEPSDISEPPAITPAVAPDTTDINSITGVQCPAAQFSVPAIAPGMNYHDDESIAGVRSVTASAAAPDANAHSTFVGSTTGVQIPTVPAPSQQEAAFFSVQGRAAGAVRRTAEPFEAEEDNGGCQYIDDHFVQAINHGQSCMLPTAVLSTLPPSLREASYVSWAHQDAEGSSSTPSAVAQQRPIWFTISL
eukprot:TRINITY_DN103834_c0_g1_i1.p1 TRINITY_DN103834_c0_g1~~TRINITY_DN103834_c0_g1_i1.p1  ORF type:complete len:451 (+),score=90.34 TRINITY_DN103834_c0_g1_i1:102-1454(+)